jgi:hypothetical protein
MFPENLIFSRDFNAEHRSIFICLPAAFGFRCLVQVDRLTESAPNENIPQP